MDDCSRLSPDGQWVVNVSGGAEAQVWDARTGQPVSAPLKHQDHISTIRFSPDSQRVVTASSDKTARVWDARTGRPLTDPLPHESYAARARFSPDGRQVITTSGGKTVHVWDAQTGQPLIEPLRHEERIVDARLSPREKLVVTVTEGGNGWIWDWNTGQRLVGPMKHDQVVVDVEFSPDGRRVVTTSYDKTARIWDAHTGQALTEPLRHADYVVSARFDPAGQRVVTASVDRTARVWDVATGLPLTEPLRHGGRVNFAEFSSDGQRIITAAGDVAARIWETPETPVPVPPWLLDLAQALAGQKLDERGIGQVVPPEELVGLMQRLTNSPASDHYGRWVRWFLADREARAISPFSDFTVPAYVQSRLDQNYRGPGSDDPHNKGRLTENTLEGLGEVVRLAPRNGLAFARLARHVLEQSPEENPRQVGEAEFYTRRALEFSPHAPECWAARAKVLERAGKLAEALEAMNRASEQPPRDPSFWNDKGLLLLKTGSTNEALQAFSMAIDLAGGPTNEGRGILTQALRNRGNLFKRLNRLAEAQTDFLSIVQIPARDPKAGPSLINLEQHYNAGFKENWHEDELGNNLAELPTGVQTLAGTEFDVRGLIQVRLDSEMHPAQVTNIKGGRACRRLHFLHAAIDAAGLTNGTQVGRYVIHLDDGQPREMPLIVGRDLADWWEQPGETNTTFTVAWTGNNNKSRRTGGKIRLFKSTWENPRPDVAVRSIDFHATHATAGPFLVAVTAEP